MGFGPSTSLATLRPDLGASLEAFDLDANARGFIAQQVFPVIEAADASGKIGFLPLADILRNENTRRNPATGYKRRGWNFSDKSFTTQEYGIEVEVDDNLSAVYRHYFDAELVSAGLARHDVLHDGERRVAAAVFDTTTWTGSALTTAVATAWSAVTSTPIKDVSEAKKKVRASSGLWPNALIINRIVFENLLQVTQILDRISASGAGDRIKPADVTEAMLAQAFGVDRLIVAGGAQNTANEGAAASISEIWSNSFAMVARVAVTNNMAEPCIGRTVHWAEDGSSIGTAFETYRDEKARMDIVRARYQVDEVRLITETGHLLSNIT